MPKLRSEDIADIDVDYLDSVEYSTEEFDRYDGEVPPIGLTLSGYTKKIWWTRSAPKANGAGDDAMLKILWIADENEGDLEQYNGCPFWLNAPLIASAKFKWDPWMLAYGFTLKKVLTTTYVSKKEDQNGAPVERIGSWHPGAEHEEAWCYVVTDQEPYQGVMQPRAKEWIAWDDYDPDAAPEDEEPEDEPEPPRRGRGTRTRSGTATRTRSAQPARGSRTASKPATAKTGARTRSGAAKPATARSGRAAPASGRRGKAAAASPARSTRTKRSGSSQDPPF